jgi:hypothetical protein
VICIWVVLELLLSGGLLVRSVTAQEPAERLTPALARQVVGEVVPQVERLRGLEFKRPVPVTVIDDPQARRHILRRLEKFDQLERMTVIQQVYESLGLVEEGTDLVEVMLEAMEQQVAGFYDPGDGSFYLLDDQPANTAAMLSAHELTHALEDQYFDLDARLEQVLDDDDRLFAVGAVHEGSATLLMMVYMMEQALEAGSAAAGAQGTAVAALDQLQDLPPVLQRQLLAPYLLGLHFLIEGDYLQLGRGFPTARVDQVFADMPTSSEQILHPEKYWREGERDEPRETTLDGVAPSLEEAGWERKGDGVLGELTLGVLVGAPTPSPDSVAGGVFDPGSWTNEAAAGWCGDRWELWRRGQETVVLWLTRWDRAEDAKEFATALARHDALRIKRKGAAVAVVSGDAGRGSSRLLGRMLAGVSRSGCCASAMPVE